MPRFTLAILLFCLPLAAQPGSGRGIRIAPVQSTALNDPQDGALARAEFETWVEGVTKSFIEIDTPGFAGTARGGGKVTFQRFVRDNLRNVYVSYAVAFEHAEVGAFRVSFGKSTADLPRDVSTASWQIKEPVALPVPQLLHEGETLSIELYADPNGRRLVDYLRAGQRAMTPRSEVPRDAYADDAEFSLTQPRLRVNGTAVKTNPLAQPVHGSLLHFDVPGFGRYLLAFKPQEGSWSRAGEVSGSSMVFTIEGNVFRVDCTARIAEAGSGTYTVYGMRESDASPGTSATFSGTTPAPGSAK